MATGTSGNDIFVHDANWGQLTDTIDGGAGIDTLQFIGTPYNIISSSAVLTNIEIIDLNGTADNSANLDMLYVGAGGGYDFSQVTFVGFNGNIQVGYGIANTSVVGSQDSEN
ncbi:MAG: hypothetical protein ACRBBQ_14970, partial [Cognatishimia sp.]